MTSLIYKNWIKLICHSSQCLFNKQPKIPYTSTSSTKQNPIDLPIINKNYPRKKKRKKKHPSPIIRAEAAAQKPIRKVEGKKADESLSGAPPRVLYARRSREAVAQARDATASALSLSIRLSRRSA